MTLDRLRKRVLIILVLAAMGLAVALASGHPGVSARVELLSRKLSGQPPQISWAQLAFRMTPFFLRAALRNLLQPSIAGRVLDLNDYQMAPNQRFEMFGLLNGQTANILALDCHYSVLAEGQLPHPPHAHGEEELIIPISGQVRVIRTGSDGISERSETTLSRGSFTYHRSGRSHTIQALGPGPSTYLVLKWKGRGITSASDALNSQDFAYQGQMGAATEDGFHLNLLFESATDQLSKLHAHTSSMTPDSGYKPHRDSHDIAIIILEGQVDTLGQRAGKNSVIFYPADSLHGMRNAGRETARYLVFEFHGVPSF